MSDSVQPDSDRRQSVRHLACFPAHIQRHDDGDAAKPRTAMIKDLSVHGAFLLTRAALPIGAPVTLALYLTTDVAEPRLVDGTVVRSEQRPLERSDFWHFDVGIQFDEPMEMLETEIRALAEHQARLGISKSSRPPPA